MSRILDRFMPGSLRCSTPSGACIGLVAHTHFTGIISTEVTWSVWHWDPVNGAAFWAAYPTAGLSKLTGTSGFTSQRQGSPTDGSPFMRIDVNGVQYGASAASFGMGARGGTPGWHMHTYSARLTGSTLQDKVYTDGRIVAERTVATGGTNFSSDGTDLTIRPLTGSGAIGVAAGRDWLLWNRTLSDAEVFNMWQTGEIPPQSLIGKWTGNNWTSGQLQDESSGARHTYSLASPALDIRSPM